ncbi:unnamed protein product [Mytilus edulis]|uniref:exodeoxyribonuclease III n=1 Tax=Mytilus edulis TaxID=6550 RepID=A0A8S3QMC7_MYTED|nr:unnamed protein product [Mytilus edulis]
MKTESFWKNCYTLRHQKTCVRTNVTGQHRTTASFKNDDHFLINECFNNQSFAKLNLRVIYVVLRNSGLIDQPIHGWYQTPRTAINTIGNCVDLIQQKYNLIFHSGKTDFTDEEVRDLFSLFKDIAKYFEHWLRKNEGELASRYDKIESCCFDIDMRSKYREHLHLLESGLIDKNRQKVQQAIDWAEKELPSICHQHKNITFYIWLGTCNLTELNRTTRYISLVNQNDSNVRYLRRKFIELKELITKIKPKSKIIFLEIPPYSIQRWNRSQGHKNPDIFSEDDQTLQNQLYLLNTFIQEINQSAEKSPKFDLDIRKTSKRKGGTDEYYNFNIYRTDGVHPNRPIKQDKREDIIIGTLNVQNVKSNALYIKNLLRDVHVLCIQEHWLFNAEKKIIAEITENSGYIAKSVDDNDDPDFNVSMKRGYGGVAIIWKKEINENIKELIDGGNRIQAIHIQQGDKPICLINVYMPSDSKNADIEYKDTLAQIDEMIEKYKDTHEIIVCGDMNGSLDRSSTPHDKILKTFCKEKCIGNTEKCPVKETFYHQNGMSKGQIDYFLFKSNSEIINKIRQIDVLDTDPENTSDHVPVILTLNSQLKKVREKATTIIAKPKWTDCDHQIYKEVINKDLPKLMQKSKGIIEQDIRNLEKLLHKAGEAAIPKYRRKIKIKSKGKAIWNEQIDKASKQSKNAYKVWRQLGAPQERSNELKIKMTAAKRILRKAQRQAYASQRESTAGKIMKASNEDTKLFTGLLTCKEKHHLPTTRY